MSSYFTKVTRNKLIMKYKIQFVLVLANYLGILLKQKLLNYIFVTATNNCYCHSYVVYCILVSWQQHSSLNYECTTMVQSKSSVTRLGEFWNFSVKNFLTKATKIFEGCFGKQNFISEKSCGYFLGNFWRKNIGLIFIPTSVHTDGSENYGTDVLQSTDSLLD